MVVVRRGAVTGYHKCAAMTFAAKRDIVSLPKVSRHITERQTTQLYLKNNEPEDMVFFFLNSTDNINPYRGYLRTGWNRIYVRAERYRGFRNLCNFAQVYHAKALTGTLTSRSLYLFT